MSAVSPVRYVPRTAWRGRPLPADERAVAEETAVAFTYNGTAHAVMMSTPLDLEDFGVGFSLTEGTVECPSEIESVEAVTFAEGIELRLWICEERMTRLRERRRRMTGPTGCGLCGIESLAEAARPVARLSGDDSFRSDQIMEAIRAIEPRQALNRETRGVHAAALWHPDRGLAVIREDVGRHNALDKLVGALARDGRSPEGCLLVLSSRISVEMVQKAAILGAAVIVAVSAPTALAVRTAAQAGITLAAVARRDGFEIFTHPRRILLGTPTPA